jgi:ApaG protein
MTAYAIQIDVLPQYVPEQSDPLHALFAFAYTITVTNTGQVAAQLISRHWIIQNDQGHTEEVQGLGVVGQQPLLQPGQSFQYTSGCRLRSASGTMRGSFFFVCEDGHRFDVQIAAFVLESTDGVLSSGITSRTLH